MRSHLLWGLIAGVLLITFSGCNAATRPVMRYVQATPLTKFLPPDQTSKTMPVGDWVQEELDACAGDQWEVSLRWEVSPGEEEADNRLSVWFVLPSENITYHGSLRAKTDAGFAIPVTRQGTLRVRTMSPYANAVIWMTATRGRPLDLGCLPGSPDKTPVAAQFVDADLPDDLPAETRETVRLMLNGPRQIYYRTELSWQGAVDMDLSSQWVLNREVPVLNWRNPRHGGSGLEEDVNNLCLSAIAEPVEKFHWYLPVDELCPHMDEMRFHVTYYSSCGRRYSEVEAQLTIYGPGDRELGRKTHVFTHTGQVEYFTLSEVLNVPACPPGWRERAQHGESPRPPDREPPAARRTERGDK